MILLLATNKKRPGLLFVVRLIRPSLPISKTQTLYLNLLPPSRIFDSPPDVWLRSEMLFLLFDAVRPNPNNILLSAHPVDLEGTRSFKVEADLVTL
jgi:hypothetical protein